MEKTRIVKARSRTSPCVLWALLFCVVTPATGRAADDQWQFGSAPSFSSGTYGTDTRTDVLHTATTARRLFKNGDLSFVFPVTCIWGDARVTVVGGSPVRTQGIGDAGTGTPTGTAGAATTGRADGTGRAGSSTVRADTAPVEAPAPGTPSQTSSGCGMGDVIVRGRYFLVDEGGWRPTIAVRAHVKAPTADADRGLGTGRPDEGMGIEISRTIVGGLTAIVDGGYTVIGQPAGEDFNNNWWYDVGLSQDLARGVVNLSMFFEESRAIVPGLDNGREVLAAVSLKGSSGWRVQVSGMLGLSDGAPDHGLTVGASRRF